MTPLTPAHFVQIIRELSSSNPNLQLLYGSQTPFTLILERDVYILQTVTPERLKMKDFMSLLDNLYENGKLIRLVVDEVPTIVQCYSNTADHQHP